MKSKKKIVVRGSVTATGTLVPYNEVYMRHLLKTRIGEQKLVSITVATVQKPRTFSQNNLYWLWLETIAEYTGYTKDELHGYYKARYGVKKQIRDVEVPKSTTEYGTAEFTEYLMLIERDVAQTLCITLPDPEDYWKNFDKFGCKSK